MSNTAPAFRKYELEESLGEKAKKLLSSQRTFIFAPERFSAISGGFASGKSYALVLKGVILSAAFPGNRGAYLCYRGSDVEKRLIPLFMEEVCPPKWIKSWNKNKGVVVLRNNSVIEFGHIKDGTGGSGAGTGTRRIGSNWSWFGVDQAEEITLEHWDALISRLRLPRVPKKFGFMSLNPGGKNWIFDRFFTKVQPWPRDNKRRALPLDGKYFQMVKQAENVLGISVNSEENRVSNGGWVDDSYFDSLLETYGEAWVERFLYGSFNDFSGRLFNDFQGGLVDYGDASVHVVDDFQIPKHWQLLCSIDVGGDSPWAVIPCFSDESGNIIVTNGFHNRTGRISEVTHWIKRNLPYDENRTRFIIDPENVPVTVELRDQGVYATPAQKAIMAGLLRLEGYLHVQPHRELPHWYADTQPPDRVFKFRGKGSPQLFVFKSATVTRKELDTARWDPDKPDHVLKTSTLRMDVIDALRYAAMEHPEPSKIVGVEDAKYVAMEKADPGTAREWREWDRRMAARKGGKAALREMDSDEDFGPKELNASPLTKYDFNDD